MIATLKGTLALKSARRIIVDVHDIGYEIEISTQTFEQLPKEGKAIKLLIYHHFTDSEQRLFGFFTQSEKQLFELLITVKGVGPKLGLTILSGLPAGDIIEAIAQADKTALTQITGIGKKTAQRMLVELQDKIEAIAASAGNASSGNGLSGDMKAEAAAALQSLGITKQAAQKAVQKASKGKNGTNSVEQLVKKALVNLNT